MKKSAYSDVAPLILRLVFGVIFVAHGWRKLITQGIDATAAGYREIGVPAPDASAWITGLGELVLGALLVIGLFTRVAAVLLALIMVGAIVFVHLEGGLFATDGGFEYPLALIAGLLALAALGSGRAGVDAALRGSGRPARRSRAS